jgi:hypothetical protein
MLGGRAAHTDAEYTRHRADRTVGADRQRPWRNRIAASSRYSLMN